MSRPCGEERLKVDCACGREERGRVKTANLGQTVATNAAEDYILFHGVFFFLRARSLTRRVSTYEEKLVLGSVRLRRLTSASERLLISGVNDIVVLCMIGYPGVVVVVVTRDSCKRCR